MELWKIFLISAGLSLLITPFFRQIARWFGIMDMPGLEARKQHHRPVAYLGGLSLFCVFAIMIWWVVDIDTQMAIFLSGLTVVVFLGLIDDVFKLSPWQKIVGQLLVGVLLVLGGVVIHSLPWLGRELSLDYGKRILEINNWKIEFAFVSAGFTILWSVFMMNALNFLDGVDGLASGVSMIALLIIAGLSLSVYVNQPEVAKIALILVGVLVGFLPYNLPKASIFLGDSGSMLLGYVMAVLAIYAGSKVATLSLVLGLAMLDALMVVYVRIKQGRRIWSADRSHLHFRLIDRGWSQWQVLFLYYGISIVLGVLALLLPNNIGKITIWLIFLAYALLYLYRWTFVQKNN